MYPFSLQLEEALGYRDFLLCVDEKLSSHETQQKLKLKTKTDECVKMLMERDSLTKGISRDSETIDYQPDQHKYDTKEISVPQTTELAPFDTSHEYHHTLHLSEDKKGIEKQLPVGIKTRERLREEYAIKRRLSGSYQFIEEEELQSIPNVSSILGKRGLMTACGSASVWEEEKTILEATPYCMFTGKATLSKFIGTDSPSLSPSVSDMGKLKTPPMIDRKKAYCSKKGYIPPFLTLLIFPPAIFARTMIGKMIQIKTQLTSTHQYLKNNPYVAVMFMESESEYITFKRYFNINDQSISYAYLLDKRCKVLEYTCGPPLVEEMISLAYRCLEGW
ncbi:hypothetical protein ADUPG1_010325 [Aduncisulcus paluster]|uniref:Uncharacterized protein n=1 Tax=Aduncisulcus paluster TaxID=2918883 RepID=A0ABQ5JWD7_9EUKA|nr:hypothetical protein ADUPG1_010325 [Aduncisulcus paluster]